MQKIIISGTGCALGDNLYTGISFDSKEFKKYLSVKTGDGGLSPGKLVFAEELEKFSGKCYSEVKKEIIGDLPDPVINVGGPSLVSLIHASQLLDRIDFDVRFYGMSGNDEIAKTILRITARTPLNTVNYLIDKAKPTPFTDVLSDPDFENGHGERTFINSIGAAAEYDPGYLDDGFFESDIVCFGGTALVPQIHDNLTDLLARAKKNDCITVVNTVFDFRNEKKNPDNRWPLGENDMTFKYIDVLISDHDEALRISGKSSITSAAGFFITTGLSSFIITNGANNILIWSDGRLFEKQDLLQLPVSKKVTDELCNNPDLKVDTTGCGDNFAGGIIASLAWQLKSRKKGHFNFLESASWGIASGGFACYTVGGTYLEKAPGEKLSKVQLIQQAYLHQIGYNSMTSIRKKLVLFGAGKIGRSFIGQLFSRGGYEVVFIDVNDKVIDCLNDRGTYNVIIKSGAIEEVIKIDNVRGVHADDRHKVIDEISNSDIAAISVGMNGLTKIFPLLAGGLICRRKNFGEKPLDIIIAENMRDADKFFRSELLKLLPENYPIDQLVGLIETSIGKMVPIMQKKHLEEDILQIFAEPYNTLILNRKAFRNPIPEIEGLAPKNNMKAWVDRKLFIHNLGHSATAYLGYMYDPDFVYLHEVLSVPQLQNVVRVTMKQAAYILLKIYPDEFKFDDLCDHIDDLINRFQNKALGDTIFRVGCDLSRKLGPSDRLAGALRIAIESDLPYNKILEALICGCHFMARDEDGMMLKEDIEFVNRYQHNIRTILKEVSGFDEINHGSLFTEAEIIDNSLRQKILNCGKFIYP